MTMVREQLNSPPNFVRRDPETYSEIDLQEYMPPDWDAQILRVAHEFGRQVNVVPSSTSRHHEQRTFRLGTVSGVVLRQELPWLFDLYDGAFAHIVGAALDEVVGTTSDEEYAVILNILTPDSDDYEPHVDNNGATLVLPVTDSGGRLVVSGNTGDEGFFDPDSEGVFAVTPIKGRGIIFDGSNKTHYVERPEAGERVTAVFEMYTRGANESHRPDDLSEAIGLKG